MKKLITISAVLLASSVTMAKNMFYPTKFSMMPKAAVLSDFQDNKLYYYGGPVIGNARVAVIYWGEVESSVSSGMGGFYSAVINSTHMDWMSMYNTNITAIDGRQGTNQQIGRGSFIGEFKIKPANVKTSLDDKEIQAELEYQVAQNVLPKPDANTLFMIHFAPGIKITIDGMKSCQAFCAYHNGFQSKSLGSVFYGVMPDFSKGTCSFGCGMGSVFETTTIVSSHELFEAITDPFPTPGDKPAFPQAWNTKYGAEVGDNCNSGTGTLRSGNKTYKVQAEWDNNTLSCRGGDYTSP